MAFPLWIILIIYLLAVLLYIILSIASLYHIIRFGYWDSSTRFMVFLYFTGSLAILAASAWFAIGIDWNRSVTLFDDVMFNISIF